MKMKPISKTILLLGVVLASGCVTRYQTCYPSSDERTIFAIGALYDDTRVLAPTNGVQRHVLLHDTQVVASAEALLLHYSQSEDPKVRGAAACRLAHFGTKAALERSLELARSEHSPEGRAGIWHAIAELLQSPPTWLLPQINPIAGSSEASADTNLVQILSFSGGEIIQHYSLMSLRKNMSDQVASDESAAASDQNFHSVSFNFPNRMRRFYLSGMHDTS